MNKLCVYLPCYNEAENIDALVLEWLAEADALRDAGFALEIVPVDDKSTDETLSIIRALEKAHPEVRVIAHEENKNLGGVLDTSVRDFLGRCVSGDLMCVMDGDNTHKPEYVHSMIAALEKPADCVIASRYQQGAQTNGVPGVRLFLSGGAKVYYSLVLRVPGVRDYTCGYRVYTYDILKRAAERYGDGLITQRTFSCMMELLYKLHRCGCRFAEVPFVLRYDDKKGSSKMSVLRTVKDSMVTALRLRLTRDP